MMLTSNSYYCEIILSKTSRNMLAEVLDTLAHFTAFGDFPYHSFKNKRLQNTSY